MIFFVVTFLYYGPVIIVDKLGIDPFLSQIILSISEMLCYLPLLTLVQGLPRVKSGKILFALATIFNALLIFIRPPQKCNGCA